jgi:predicted transposase/invertase (TIGR01784 family)
VAQKDIISKQLIQRIAVDLAVYLLKLDIGSEDLELVATEQQRVEDRRADVVAKVRQAGTEFILHIEIQNNNDVAMPLRMLRYYTDIAFAHPGIAIHQYLIYIGAPKLTMLAHKSDYGLDYRYTIIDMHTVDYQDLLNQDTPDAIVLAILADFKHHSSREAVHEIIMRLHQKLNLQPQRLREYLYMLEVLSENRNLKTYIKEAENMITQVNIETLPSYELGMEKGMQKGVEKGMEQGIRKVIRQLLATQSPEQVAQLTNLPVDRIMEIKKQTS